MTLDAYKPTLIRTQANLSDLWKSLMGAGGFGDRILWFTFLDGDDRTMPVLSTIEDLPEEPDPLVIKNLGRIVGELVTSTQARAVLMLLSRPGTESMTAQDSRWATQLRSQVALPFGNWPIHLATRGRVRVLAPDDLISA